MWTTGAAATSGSVRRSSPTRGAPIVDTTATSASSGSASGSTNETDAPSA